MKRGVGTTKESEPQSESSSQAPHLALLCLLLPLSSGNGEKLKQTLVHLLIPPPGKRDHKLSSYFLWPWGELRDGQAEPDDGGVWRLCLGAQGGSTDHGCSGHQGGRVKG